MKPRLFFYSRNRFLIPVCNFGFLWCMSVACGNRSARFLSFDLYCGITANALHFGAFLWLLLWQLLPILIIWYGTTKGKSLLCVAVVLLKGYFVGVSATVVATLYQSAGWLVYTTLLFSNTVSSLAVFWLSIYCAGHRVVSVLSYCTIAAIIVVVCAFDFVYISNFCVLF